MFGPKASAIGENAQTANEINMPNRIVLTVRVLRKRSRIVASFSRG